MRQRAGICEAVLQLVADRSKILVVDDESIVLDVTRMAIEMLDRFTVTAYGDPRMALLEFESDPAGFSLVVTDFKMPWMNGSQLAARIRELNPVVPILCVSAFVQPVFRSEVLFTERLSKPFDIVELQERVLKLVESGTGTASDLADPIRSPRLDGH